MRSYLLEGRFSLLCISASLLRASRGVMPSRSREESSRRRGLSFCSKRVSWEEGGAEKCSLVTGETPVPRGLILLDFSRVQRTSLARSRTW